MDSEKTKRNKAKFLKAFPKYNRKIAGTAKAIKVSRNVVHFWINTDLKFRQALADQEEDEIDEVEGSLFDMCMGYTQKLKRQKVLPSGEVVEFEVEIYIPKNIGAVKYFLDAKGRERGYGRKLDDPEDDVDVGENETDETDEDDIRQTENNI
jgi:hypothetical protein